MWRTVPNTSPPELGQWTGLALSRIVGHESLPLAGIYKPNTFWTNVQVSTGNINYTKTCWGLQQNKNKRQDESEGRVNLPLPRKRSWLDTAITPDERRIMPSTKLNLPCEYANRTKWQTRPYIKSAERITHLYLPDVSWCSNTKSARI